MIGIVAAMDLEVQAFRKMLCEETIVERQGSTYYLGTIANQRLILTKSGVGKVACAYHTTKLLDYYHPHLLINVGVAGSLNADVRPLDVVVGTQVCQHDVFVPDWPRGFNQEKTCVSANRELLEIAKGVRVDFPVHFGPIASGDTFVEKVHTERLLCECEGVLCAEMEAGALAEVARLSHTRFLVLRAVSDVTIEEGNALQFEELAPAAAERSSLFTRKFLEVYHGELV